MSLEAPIELAPSDVSLRPLRGLQVQSESAQWDSGTVAGGFSGDLMGFNGDSMGFTVAAEFESANQ